jgi:hypothetical protein
VPRCASFCRLAKGLLLPPNQAAGVSMTRLYGIRQLKTAVVLFSLTTVYRCCSFVFSLILSYTMVT